MMNLDKMALVKLIGCLLLLSSCVTEKINSNSLKSPNGEILPNKHVKFDGLSLHDDPYHQQIEKRGIFKGVLFAVSIAATLSNVALDVYLGNNGCCKIQRSRYKDACEKMEDVTTKAATLVELGKKLDKVNLQADKSISYLDRINTDAAAMNNQIERLRDLEETIIEVMSPRILNVFKEKAAEIKRLLQQQKSNISEAKPLNATKLYEPLYKSWRGLAKLFQTAGIHILSELGQAAFDRVLYRKLKREIRSDLQNRVTLNQGKANSALKARRLLGATDNLDDLAKSMAKVKLRTLKSATTMGRAFSAFNTGLIIAGIGGEVYEFISKLKECSRNTDKLQQVQTKLEQAIAETRNVLAKMESGYKDIVEQYQSFRTALTNESVTDVIQEFGQLVLSAAPAARRRMHRSEVNIGIFLKYQKAANPSLMTSLQRFLKDGLKGITIRYDCMLKRTQAINATITDCEDGKYTLEENYRIHAARELLHKCVTLEGEPFSTFDQVKQVITYEIAERKKKFNLNCLLNYRGLTDNLCEKKCKEGFSYADILQGYPSISENELKDICEPCPTNVPLTPQDKQNICRSKRIWKATVTSLYSFFPSASREEINDVYNKCPST